MRRREKSSVETEFGTPLRLMRFEAAEWPAEEHQEAADSWHAAREEWKEEHGGVDTDDEFPLPDESFSYQDL